MMAGLLYDLPVEVEELTDGSDYRYLATSPDLPHLLVVSTRSANSCRY